MALQLLAITRLAGCFLYGVAILYVAMIGYVLLGGWSPRSGLARVRLIWFLLLPSAVFIVLWFCGLAIWWIPSFMTTGVDAPHFQYGSKVSAVIAVFVAATVFVRLSVGRADLRFRKVCVLGVAALFVLYSAMRTVDFTSGIWGWTARGAAENNLARFRGVNHPFVDPNAQKRIVEEPLVTSLPNREGAQRFVLYYGDAPIQHVTVVPYGWWWWTVSSSGPAIPFDLDRAVDYWETDPEEAAKWLEEVIESYPNSDAGKWAAKSLDGLRKDGRSGTPTWRSEMLRRFREETLKCKDAGTQD